MVDKHILTEIEIAHAKQYLRDGTKSKDFYVLLFRMRQVDIEKVNEQVELVRRVLSKFEKERRGKKK
jgi:hypothetical protein